MTMTGTAPHQRPEKIPVFLVEDDVDESGQIAAWLNSNGFDVSASEAGSQMEAFQFKSSAVTSQLYVVDLNLRLKHEPDPREGVSLVRNILWPLDRSSYFVVFTRYIDVLKERQEGVVEPNWIILQKKYDQQSGSLTDDCLNDLTRVLRECVRYLTPNLEAAFIDLERVNRVVSDYERTEKMRIHPDDLARGVRDSLFTSESRFKKCAHECVSFSRSGADTIELAIGVYGSTGRLEARETSDIEFSIFYFSDGTTRQNSDLIASYWNRLAVALHRKNVLFQGNSRIAEGRLLDSREVGNAIENRYCETVNVAQLLKPIRENAHFRNRHFQLLFETRAILNPTALLKMKQRVVFGQLRLTNKPTHFESLLQGTYLSEIVSQNCMDLSPDGVLDRANWKKFCYRSLNVLALRIGLAGEMVTSEALWLKTDEEWKRLFDWMAYPGVLKLMHLHNRVLSSLKESPEKDAVLQHIDRAIVSYAESHSLLDLDYDEFRPFLKKAIGVCDRLKDVCGALLAYREFHKVSSDYRWLLSVEPVDFVRDRLLAAQA